jgi:hypothetical protein
MSTQCVKIHHDCSLQTQYITILPSHWAPGCIIFADKNTTHFGYQSVTCASEVTLSSEREGNNILAYLALCMAQGEQGAKFEVK